MTDPALALPLAAVLVCIAFLSGIGITAVGPGGIFVTIALYALTTVPSNTVAGTAHATFIVTGLVGSAAYRHSGEMRTGDARVMAVVLSLASVVGAVLGAAANAHVPRALFGLLLGAVAVATGAVLIHRELRGLTPRVRLDVTRRRDRVALAGLGLLLGAASGLLGVGGPVLAVPALLLVGVPMLVAVAVAQVQSVFIAAFATVGYALQGAVSLPLAALVGVPLLAGVLAGWRVAHLVAPRRLKIALGLVLVAVGPVLAL